MGFFVTRYLDVFEHCYHFRVAFNVIDSESDTIVALLAVKIQINRFERSCMFNSFRRF